MTKVRIDTPGATIEVEADGDLAEVSDQALELFREAGGWPRGDGPAFGFSQERRYSPSVYPVGNGSYSSPSGPVEA